MLQGISVCPYLAYLGFFFGLCVEGGWAIHVCWSYSAHLDSFIVFICVFKIRLKLPCGKRITRTFAASSSLALLYRWTDCVAEYCDVRRRSIFCLLSLLFPYIPFMD